MTLNTKALPREFTYNGVKLPDPDPIMSAEQVRDFYTTTYPEIATAAITGPEDAGNALRYSFGREIGTKG
jgi:PRTRC genetic system protein C